MKIIDWERNGNIVRFYLGVDSLENWYGDDWDDTPYEHNADTVYQEYVAGTMDIAFPFDAEVSEPCDGYWNSPYCKDDFKSGAVPIITVEFAETDASETPMLPFFMGQHVDDGDPRIGDCSICNGSDSPAYLVNESFPSHEFLADEANIMADAIGLLLGRVADRGYSEPVGEVEALDRILAYAFDDADDIDDFYSIVDNLGRRFGLEDDDLEWLEKQLGL